MSCLSNIDQGASILIADDDLIQRTSIKSALEKDHFSVVEAADGVQALEIYNRTHPSIVLLDVVMPGLNGFEVCRKIREMPCSRYVPIIISTGTTDASFIDESYKAGATDFVTKPINGHLLGYRARNMLRSANTAQALADREQEIIDTRLEIIKRLGVAAEFRDNETGNHIIRMSRYAELLARNLNMSEEQCELILHASPMHDIGKIGIPDGILFKKGKLSAKEFVIIKTHTHIGANMLAGSKSELLRAAHTISLTHHEKWNGGGYPNGLAGENIPVLGRVCAVADVFDALTSVRPYKEAWSLEESMDEIYRLKGSHLDPLMVDIFTRLRTEVGQIMSEFTDAVDAIVSENQPWPPGSMSPTTGGLAPSSVRIS